MRKITHIIVHCSDSRWGDRAVIDTWHKARGMNGIGYNDVIGNPYPTAADFNAKRPVPGHDGKLLGGREIGGGGSDAAIGAHAYGFNANGLRICLIGRKGTFTDRQLAVLIDWLVGKALAYGVPVERILGHCETEHGRAKTCPEIDMAWLRGEVRKRLALAGR